LGKNSLLGNFLLNSVPERVVILCYDMIITLYCFLLYVSLLERFQEQYFKRKTSNSFQMLSYSLK
jgi:hypothetical protein